MSSQWSIQMLADVSTWIPSQSSSSPPSVLPIGWLDNGTPKIDGVFVSDMNYTNQSGGCE